MSAGLPVFVHVHVPKTAGTSLNALLQQWFKDQHKEFYHPDPAHFYSEEELDSLVRQNPGLLSFASHSVRFFPPLLGGRVALYYCFLRDPVEWLVSGFTYAKKNYAEFSEEHRRLWPPQIQSMSFRDLYVYRREQRKTNPESPDNTRLIAHPLNRFLSEASFRRKQFLLSSDETNGSLKQQFNGVCVALSTAALDSFAMVGLTEKFAESVELLRQLITSFGIPAERVPVPHSNTSRELREDLSWINEDDEIGKLVLRSTNRDRKVYEYGKAKFKRAYQDSLQRSQAAVARA